MAVVVDDDDKLNGCWLRDLTAQRHLLLSKMEKKENRCQRAAVNEDRRESLKP